MVQYIEGMGGIEIDFDSGEIVGKTEETDQTKVFEGFCPECKERRIKAIQPHHDYNYELVICQDCEVKFPVYAQSSPVQCEECEWFLDSNRICVNEDCENYNRSRTIQVEEDEDEINCEECGKDYSYCECDENLRRQIANVKQTLASFDEEDWSDVEMDKHEVKEALEEDLEELKSKLDS